MANVYTPGLKISERAVVRRVRRLPLQGDVLVEAGRRVLASDVVARALLPGKVYPVQVAHQLGVAPEELPDSMRRREGEAIAKGELLAESAGFLGYFKSRVIAPVTGVVESISKVTGQVMLREAPRPVELIAYVDGRVVEIIPGEGVVVEARASFLQGIFGLCGEAHGPIRMLAKSRDEVLEPSTLNETHRGAVVIGGSFAPLATLRRAIEVGASALVVGGVHYDDVRALLGHDLGVAITGGEALGTTFIVTEGFGRIDMATRSFALLRGLEGRIASVNGSTQIRAGVIRPELLVPLDEGAADDAHEPPQAMLDVGALVRCIRVPFFGRIGRITQLPSELAQLESETVVRVLEVEFDDGERRIVPRANVEAIEG